MKNTDDFKGKKGFTLIELLVVIAIIGILSGIGLVSLNGAREKARDAQRVSDLAQYRTALAIYYDSSNFKYPPGVGGGDSNTINGDCIDNQGWTYWSTSSGGLLDTHTAPGMNINVFMPSYSTPIIPKYLASPLWPPTAVGTPIQAQGLYCYDVNGDLLTEDNSMYLLYTRLESGNKEWYWIGSKGDWDQTPTAHAFNTCVSNGAAADVCTW